MYKYYEENSYIKTDIFTRHLYEEVTLGWGGVGDFAFILGVNTEMDSIA